MRFDKHFTTTLEIDPTEINEVSSFLDKTKVEPDKNGHIYLDVEVEYSGNYESSSCFGTWENSQPDELSLDIDGIYFGEESLNIAGFFGQELTEKVEELAKNHLGF